MAWTDDQKRAIDARGGRILVSAAAGSGKTAVLVARILERILDEKDPVDVDELLIMTFTRAAASEMKERIQRKIEDMLRETPATSVQYLRLKRQATLVDCARISTIDSFCRTVIVENLDHIDLDPSFMIADQETLSLMREDVMDNLMEEEYEKKSEDFLKLVNGFATSKSDERVRSFIFLIYQEAQSKAWPKKWLDEQVNADIGETIWGEYLKKSLHLVAENILDHIDRAIRYCNEENGPEPYIPLFEAERMMAKNLFEASSVKELQFALDQFEFERLPTVRKGKADEELKNLAKGIRDEYKSVVKDKLKKSFLVEDTRGDEETITTLVRLAKEFGERFQEKKKEKNIVDFNDLEHFALDILWDEGQPSTVAQEYQRQFKEIYIDEYQDSNDVQEELVRAIEKKNVFMVGDVKQSIYGFRQAKPALFMEKFEQFLPYCEQVEGEGRKIVFSKNFRSRSEVLSAVNSVFFQLMRKEFGGILYDDEVALHLGADYQESHSDMSAQLLLLETQEAQVDESNMSLEARMVAKKIQEMMASDFQVFDKEKNRQRKLRYSDIVILLRSQESRADTFMETFLNLGVPAYAQTGKGYFDTYEVQKMLSLLSVIDNPYQDIPMAAFLHSPIANLSDVELANITSVYKKNLPNESALHIYDACQYALENQSTFIELETVKKLQSADDLLCHYRRQAGYMTISELIRKIYEETGFLDYVSAMPAGEVRKGNLYMLLEKAKGYERTGYTGLFHFVRYIENLKEYNNDFGEASTLGEFDDTVRIMTIHKSKGLEFPVVFLCDASKKFNQRDSSDSVVVDADLGIGCDIIDLKRRTKQSSLKKNVIAYKKKNDSMAEELRIFYVALTRAKEKLIVTANVKDVQKAREKKNMVGQENGLSYMQIQGATSYLDWLLMCERSMAMEVIVEGVDGLRQEEEKTQEKSVDIRSVLSSAPKYRDEKLEAVLDYQYPHQIEVDLKTKMSVSELKYIGEDVDDEASESPYVQREERKKKSPVDAAKLGTAYHTAMERLDYGMEANKESIENYFDQLVVEGRIRPQERKYMKAKRLEGFLHSNLGAICKKANLSGNLCRERQFVMGLSAQDLGIAKSEELILVQGMIDAYIEEEDGIILIDYKTDVVKDGKILREKYEKQLDYYQKALEKLTGRSVKERIIWSFALNKAISC